MITNNASEAARHQANTQNTKTRISCDQIAWLKDVVDRYDCATRGPLPGISRLREAAKLAALLEIMELLNLECEDNVALSNLLAGFRELRPLTLRPLNTMQEGSDCG